MARKRKDPDQLPINKRVFTYEILLSKGLGKLTPKASQMLLDLGNNAINTVRHKYSDSEDVLDCSQHGLMKLFEKWQSFNPDVTTNTFAYFTEIYKRGVNEGFNDIYAKKGLTQDKYVKDLYINSSNNGQGLYNF
jgi:hypothetical protein